MTEHEYRPIAYGGLKASLSALVALTVLAFELYAPWESSWSAWPARVVGVTAATFAVILVGIEAYQTLRGPRLVYRADPDTGRVSSHASRGRESFEGARGFHCVVRLRGWRHRAEVYHAGTRTGMSLAVVRVDPDVGEVLALWRDGHAIESTVYVRVDDLLTALAVLSASEVQLLLSSESSEPMAGLVFALIGRRMASYKMERDRAEWDLGVSQAALAAAESHIADLTAEVEAARSRASSLHPRVVPREDDPHEADELTGVTIDEDRLRERARTVEPKPAAGGRVGRAVGKVLDVASQVAGVAGHAAERVVGRVRRPLDPPPDETRREPTAGPD